MEVCDEEDPSGVSGERRGTIRKRERSVENDHELIAPECTVARHVVSYCSSFRTVEPYV